MKFRDLCVDLVWAQLYNPHRFLVAVDALGLPSDCNFPETPCQGFFIMSGSADFRQVRPYGMGLWPIFCLCKIDES